MTDSESSEFEPESEPEFESEFEPEPVSEPENKPETEPEIEKKSTTGSPERILYYELNRYQETFKKYEEFLIKNKKNISIEYENNPQFIKGLSLIKKLDEMFISMDINELSYYKNSIGIYNKLITILKDNLGTPTDKKYTNVAIQRVYNKYLEDKKEAGMLLIEDKSSNILNLKLLNKLKTYDESYKSIIIKCILKQFKKLSFIQHLEQNTVKVLKYNQTPNLKGQLQQFLAKNPSFRIPENVIISDLIKKLPEGDREIEENKEYIKGSVIVYVLKEQYRGKKLDEEPNNETHYIISPLIDEYYEELSKTPNEEIFKISETIMCWELNIFVPEIKKKLIKRYINFEEYLHDLKKIYIENIINLKDEKLFVSAGILIQKVKDINNYLKITEPDKELDIPDIEQELTEQRKLQYDKLAEYILEYYPNSNEFIRIIEEQIYNIDKINYITNVSKILFIFNLYNNKLIDLIQNQTTIFDLLRFEEPTINQDEDLNNSPTIDGKLDILKKWKPDCSLYEEYKSKLEEVNNNEFEFGKNNTNLSFIQIKKIFREKNDCEKWKEALENVDSIRNNTINQKFRYLKQQRNQLICRRTYRIATIQERIDVIDNFKRVLANILNNLELKSSSEIIELIIYNNIKDRDNNYNNYKVLASIVKDEINFYLKESGKKEDTIFNQPIKLTNFIEFIIKEGSIRDIPIERINELLNNISTIKDDEVYEFVKIVREKDLKIYRDALKINQYYLTEPDSKLELFKKAINKQIQINNNEKIKLKELIKDNTYIPPIITEKPDYSFKNFITLRLNIYLCGGHFPEFRSTINRDTINYTKEELKTLSRMLEIQFEDSEQLEDIYDKCRAKITLLTSSNEKIVILKDPKVYEPLYTYEPTLSKSIKCRYTDRPKSGVPSPGTQVYRVHKSANYEKYAVPFEYESEEKIPVYNSKFKKEEYSDIIVEGPVIYRENEDDINTLLSSENYILVEYINKYGFPVLYREGVAENKITMRDPANYNACERFKNEEDCNNENSRGLNNVKCKYVNNNCISEPNEDTNTREIYNKIKNINLNDLNSVEYFKKLSSEEQTEFKDKITKNFNTLQRDILTENLNEDDILQKSNKIKIDLIKDFTQLILPYYILQITNLERENVFKTLQVSLSQPPKTDFSKIVEHPLLPAPTATATMNVKPAQRVESSEYKTIELPYKVNKEIIFRGGSPESSSSVIATNVLNREFKITTENYELLTKPKKFHLKFTYIIEKSTYSLEDTKDKSDKLMILTKLPPEETHYVPLNLLYLEYYKYIKNNNEDDNNIIVSEMIYNTMGELYNSIYNIDSDGFYYKTGNQSIMNMNDKAKVRCVKFDITRNEVINKFYNLPKGQLITEIDIVNNFQDIIKQSIIKDINIIITKLNQFDTISVNSGITDKKVYEENYNAGIKLINEYVLSEFKVIFEKFKNKLDTLY